MGSQKRFAVRGWTLVVGLTCLAGAASAQISAPPTKAPDPTPEYVPPPPSATPAIPNPGTKAPPPAIPQMDPDPPLRDKEGKLVKITQPLFWQAMSHNVTITPTAREQAKGFLERRLRKYEKIVTDNADLLRQVNEGVIDKADLLPKRNDEKGRKGIQDAGPGKVSLSGLMQILKPLVGDNCREELQKAGILTRMQAQQNVKVMQRYNSELAQDFEKSLPKLADDADAKAKADRKETTDRERMRQQMYQWIDEAMHAYAGLLDDAAGKLDDYLAKAKVDAGAVKTEVGAVKAAKDRDGRVAAMKALMLKLTVDQERSILQAVRETRPKLEEPEAKPAEETKTDEGFKPAEK